MHDGLANDRAERRHPPGKPGRDTAAMKRKISAAGTFGHAGSARFWSCGVNYKDREPGGEWQSHSRCGREATRGPDLILVRSARLRASRSLILRSIAQRCVSKDAASHNPVAILRD